MQEADSGAGRGGREGLEVLPGLCCLAGLRDWDAGGASTKMKDSGWARGVVALWQSCGPYRASGMSIPSLPRPDPPDLGHGLRTGVQLRHNAPDQLCRGGEPLPSPGQHGAPQAGWHGAPGEPHDLRASGGPGPLPTHRLPHPSGLSAGSAHWPDHSSNWVRLIVEGPPPDLCPLINLDKHTSLCHLL